MKLKIFTFPDSVLAQTAKPISRIEKPHRKLADDMLETMYDAPGIGLAAPQVGILERAIVLDTEYDSDETPLGPVARNKDPKILFNPEIVSGEGEVVFEEGCLSVPGFHADVKRKNKIRLRYLDADGLEREMTAEGLQAIAIQHELDHLEGKLFIDRISAIKREMARKRLRRELAERDLAGPEGLPPGSPTGSKDTPKALGPRKKGL